MDKRLYALAAAGAIIAGLCAFKMSRTYPPQHSIAPRAIAEPAPPFELYDQSSPSKLVRLVGYLGRNEVFVVFFDGKAGADRSAVLARLRDEYHRLHHAGIYVMAISEALPQQNRKLIAAHGAFPFPLLSDPDFHVHKAWGRFDEKTGTTRSGVFLVDREGHVDWSPDSDKPRPLADWQAALAHVLEGA